MKRQTAAVADLLTYGTLTTAVAWLLTYVTHSTVLIGGAWLAVRLGIVSGPGGREALWKTALVGGVLTATVQMAIVTTGSEAHGEVRGLWAYRGLEQQVLSTGPVGFVEEFDVVVRRREAGTPHEELAAMLPLPSGTEARLTKPSSACVAALRGMATGGQAFQEASDACAGRAFDWRFALLSLWGLGAALLVLRLARTRIGLRAALAGKVDLDSGEAREILDELLGSSGIPGRVRLTASPALESPAVVGPKEICLPLLAECGLTRSELRVVLAHELAHVARWDLVWSIFSRHLAALLFIQPLNRLAIRWMEHEAEFLCDDWAIRQTGEPMALARSLTRISEWLTSPPPAPALAVVRDTGTPLTRRVRRILAPVSERQPGGRGRVLVLVVLLLGATAFVPRIPLPSSSRIHVVRLKDTGLRAMPLGGREGGAPSAGQAVFIRAVRVEVTAP
ncbi:MAG: hypothetical protein BMS9Abin29_0763 [Gemmatimonadota bacterium]|nr:MAG: hypothetical protein BMS9Abin29_0763 [Gemmatimonadota bacterium]